MQKKIILKLKMKEKRVMWTPVKRISNVKIKIPTWGVIWESM